MNRYVVEHRKPVKGERYFIFLPGTIAPRTDDAEIAEATDHPIGVRAVIVQELP